jgi:hypothetical protein
MVDIIGALDEEIARLSQARALLSGNGSGKRRGRPVGSGVGSGAVNGRKVATRAGKGLSAEGRARIAKAMRDRWAAKKKAAGAKKPA